MSSQRKNRLPDYLTIGSGKVQDNPLWLFDSFNKSVKKNLALFAKKQTTIFTYILKIR